MGKDAIATLACAAAQSTFEKQAAGLGGLGKGIGTAMEWLGKGALRHPLLAAGGVGAGVASADALGGLSGNWGGPSKGSNWNPLSQGGSDWHPWSQPGNWASNILMHPIRSLAEASGHGERGPASKNIYGKPVESMENGKLVQRCDVTKQWSPHVQGEADKYNQMKTELAQRMQQLKAYGYPVGDESKPEAPKPPAAAAPEWYNRPGRYNFMNNQL